MISKGSPFQIPSQLSLQRYEESKYLPTLESEANWLIKKTSFETLNILDQDNPFTAQSPEPSESLEVLKP